MQEQMTDFQFRKLLEMVLEIMKKSQDLQEATKAIENLLSEPKA